MTEKCLKSCKKVFDKTKNIPINNYQIKLLIENCLNNFNLKDDFQYQRLPNYV